MKGDEAAAGRAVWLTNGTGIDIACIPLTPGAAPPAVVAAAAPGGLREADFDLLLTLANFAAAARAGREPHPSSATASGTTDPLDPPADSLTGCDDERNDGTISLSPDIARSGPAGSNEERLVVPGDAATLRIDAWQHALALEALRRSDGNVPAAARLLGVSRATLYRRLEGWGLTRDAGPPAPE